MEQRNATTSNVSADTSAVTILSESVGRVGWCVYNDSSATCYLKFGAAATLTSYTTILEPDEYFESPSFYPNGTVTAIWSAATGTARVTEVK